MSTRKEALAFICKRLTQLIHDPQITLDTIFYTIDREWWSDPRNKYFPRTSWAAALRTMRETTIRQYPERNPNKLTGKQ